MKTIIFETTRRLSPMSSSDDRLSFFNGEFDNITIEEYNTINDIPDEILEVFDETYYKFQMQLYGCCFSCHARDRDKIYMILDTNHNSIPYQVIRCLRNNKLQQIV